VRDFILGAERLGTSRQQRCRRPHSLNTTLLASFVALTNTTMSAYNPFDDTHRLRDPLAEDQRLSRGITSAASSRIDLLKATPGLGPDKEFFPDLNPYVS
jgi:hypothetical protein